MKKLFALSLAALMVMSMATVAFAADPKLDSTKPGVKAVDGVATTATTMYTESDGEVKTAVAHGGRVDPGKTVYIPLMTGGNALVDDGASPPKYSGLLTGPSEIVTLADAVKSISVSTKYTLGQPEVDSIKIVYKKYNNASLTGTTGYGYFLAVAFKSSVSTAGKDFVAEVTLKKTSGVDKGVTIPTPAAADSLIPNGLAFDAFVLNVAATLKYDNGATAVGSSYKIFDLDSETTLTFDKFDGVEFEVDATGQGKILVKADAKYNAEVAGKHDANIDFFNGYGATFNRIGELRLPAKPDSVLYAIAADGSLKAVANAEYDSGMEAFVVKTRTLGYYAIADKELDVTESVPAPVEPETPVVQPEQKPNVNTGAAA